MIKLLHGADFHLDSPFDALPEEKAILRRQEQRELLDKMAILANKEQVDVVLLSGDLLDSDKSYYETGEALLRAFGQIKVPIFIAPGNHDYYHPTSPWAALALPKHVHVFQSAVPEAVELSGGRGVVWGAAFMGSRSGPLLADFPGVADKGKINLMTLHGQVGGTAEGVYNPITTEQIAASRLDYLALGHEHQYSGLQKAGDTYYAYSGCALGRGFDEEGPRGVVIAEVGKGSVSQRFIPLGGRQYLTLAVDLTDKPNLAHAIAEALPSGTEQDIARIVLAGEFAGAIDTAAITTALSDRFFHLTVRDETRIQQDIWAKAEEDTLRGLFLRKMRARYDAGDAQEKAQITWAIRYALSAMEHGEQWRI
ncbi:MAG: DNA repair exonuclease [Oscillospiraceae bacterium]|nr:DNA repair exonuclease [Oscillospiraceae bacterium]